MIHIGTISGHVTITILTEISPDFPGKSGKPWMHWFLKASTTWSPIFWRFQVLGVLWIQCQWIKDQFLWKSQQKLPSKISLSTWLLQTYRHLSPKFSDKNILVYCLLNQNISIWEFHREMAIKSGSLDGNQYSCVPNSKFN